MKKVDDGQGTIFDSVVDEVFDHWKRIFNRSRSRMTPDVKEHIVRATDRWGYSADDLRIAFIGVTRTPFYMGKNADGVKYVEIQTILKTGDRVNTFLEVGAEHLAAVAAQASAEASRAAPVQKSAMPADTRAALSGFRPKIVNGG